MADPNTVQSAIFDEAPASNIVIADVVTTNPPDEKVLAAQDHEDTDADPIALDGVRIPPNNALQDANGHFLLVTS